MTNAEARQLYITAVDPDQPYDAREDNRWWPEVCEEMRAVVGAKSDRAAAEVIRWWQDEDAWRQPVERSGKVIKSATAMARHIRTTWIRQCGGMKI